MRTILWIRIPTNSSLAPDVPDIMVVGNVRTVPTEPVMMMIAILLASSHEQQMTYLLTLRESPRKSNVRITTARNATAASGKHPSTETGPLLSSLRGDLRSLDRGALCDQSAWGASAWPVYGRRPPKSRSLNGDARGQLGCGDSITTTALDGVGLADRIPSCVYLPAASRAAGGFPPVRRGRFSGLGPGR